MEGVYVKTEPEPIPHASTSEPPVPLAVPLEAQPCRLCANIPDRAIEIYSTEGLSNQLSDRINEYLPVKVSPDDKLPLCCCWTCVTTLLSFHELVVACVEAEKRLQIIEPPKPILVPALPDPEPDIVEFNDDDAEMMDADDGEGDIDGDDDYEPENEDDDEESEEETKPIPGTSDDTESKPEIKNHPKCETCGKTFTQQHRHLQHRIRVHGEPAPKTRKSEKRLQMKKLIESSKVYDENQVCRFKCAECGHIFKSRSAFTNHQTIHTGEKRFCCHICGKNFRLSSGLKVHINEFHLKIRNFPCEYCDRVFTAKSFRDAHLNIHTKTRPYVCEVCGKAFTQSGSLHVHKLYHSDVFRFKCEICDKKFRRAAELKIHNRRHTGERPYKCKICDAGFIESKSLNVHVKIHDTSKTFTCGICGNTFKQERYLRNHLRNHRKKGVAV